jgi:hypothetical protein
MASLKYYVIQGTVDTSNPPPTVVGSTLPTPLVAMRPFNSKKNISFRVITYDVESAIRLVKERHPDIFITAVSLKDKIDCIDPAVIMEVFEKKEE